MSKPLPDRKSVGRHQAKLNFELKKLEAESSRPTGNNPQTVRARGLFVHQVDPMGIAGEQMQKAVSLSQADGVS